jgi:putative ABC transport system permease protein
MERYKEEVRDARGVRWLEEFGADLRFAVRMARRRPGLTVVIVATLALGIGASIAIHDAGRALATHAIPFPEPDRLVTVELRDGRGLGGTPSYREFRLWESAAEGVLATGAFVSGEFFVGDGSQTFRAFGAGVTGGFFPVLGVEPLLGRTLGPADTAQEDGPVAVITERLWKGRFGADPGIVGRSIRIGGVAHTVIGVVPVGLQFPAAADLWMPLVPGAGASSAAGAAMDEAESLRVSAVGRLRAGASVREAEAALATIRSGLDAEQPAGEGDERVAVAALTGVPDGADRIALILLQVAVVVLLLVTSTNAAGLMLTRAVERRQEVAVRDALGASRGRVVRQLLVESILLAALAGGLGLVVAQLAIVGLRSAVPTTVSRHMLGWERFGLDWHAVGLGLTLAALTGVAFGLVPALRAVRGDLTVHLRDGAPTTTVGRRGSRVARLFLCGEVALALMLLLTAGLLARSLSGLLTADPGFEAEGVLAVEWALPPDRYEAEDAIVRFQEPILERLGGAPGVGAVAVISNLPMSRTGWSKPFRVKGSDPTAEASAASWRPITPGYLPAMGIELVRGRHLARGDGAGAQRVAIVGEALASRHWPDGAEPLGQTLEVEGEEWTVVGVVRDVHNFGARRRAEPTIYVPQAQSPTRAGFLVVRAAGDPTGLAQRIRDEIWGIDPDIALGEIRTMSGMVREFYWNDQLTALLMTAFAVGALLITVVSLYALVAHSVARRRHEIGIRLALGARPRLILLGTISQGVTWVALGIVIGMILALGAARGLAALLYGIGPLDPVVFVLVPAGVLAVAVLASYLPALRATAVDPIETLRGG